MHSRKALLSGFWAIFLRRSNDNPPMSKMRGKRTSQEISHCSVIDLMENGPEIRAWNTVKCVFLCRGGSELQRSGGVHIQIGDWRIFLRRFHVCCCCTRSHTCTLLCFSLLKRNFLPQVTITLSRGLERALFDMQVVPR